MVGAFRGAMETAATAEDEVAFGLNFELGVFIPTLFAVLAVLDLVKLCVSTVRTTHLTPSLWYY
jgi:hypothetical protein